MFAKILEVYDGSTETQVEVHINASAKAFGAILLQKYAATKCIQPIAYCGKKYNNI